MLRIFVLDLASTLIRCPAGETTFRVSAGLGARGRVGRRPVESRGPDMREADPAEAKAENANSEEFAITKYGEVLQWYRANRNKYPPPHWVVLKKILKI
ncbi:hypothetical protein MTO96_015995 [Rhipicephalus appendiculatus]